MMRCLPLALVLVLAGCAARSPAPAKEEADLTYVARTQTASRAAAARELAPGVPERVLFAPASVALSAQARAAVRAQAAWLLQNPAARLELRGHSDARLDAATGLALALARARAVRAELVRAGVAPQRISERAFGRTRPALTCAREICWTQNRRVVSVVQ